MQALQEFKELSEEYSEEEMVTLLPYWTSVYTKLALDCDGRVREQSQGCLLSVVRKVGRKLAPHLPHLAGLWYLAQYDPHLPAASAASQAWAAAFPPAKQAGALNFCKGQIVSLIIENLTLATPHTLSDPNLTTPEEMEAKYVRTLSMSMTALAALMERAPPSASQLESLLHHQKFWKFGRRKEGNVRQGFYEVLTQLCSLQPQLAASQLNILLPALVMLNILLYHHGQFLNITHFFFFLLADLVHLDSVGEKHSGFTNTIATSAVQYRGHHVSLMALFLIFLCSLHWRS